MKPIRDADRRVVLVIAVALCTHALLGVLCARRMSVTHDEYWHLPLGLRTWHTGRFDFDKLNPPLTRLWCALPLLCTAAVDAAPADTSDPANFGTAFLHANRERYQELFFLGRCMNIVLSVLTGLLLAVWSRRMFGRAACCLTVVLWSACPNVLGNAALVTPDLGLTLLFVATAWALWEFSGKPTWWRAAVLGLFLGLAQATKFTAVLLYPLCFLMWLCLRAGARGATAQAAPAPGSARRLCGQGLALLAISIAALNAAYLFRGSFSSLGDYRFQSRSLSTVQAGLSWLQWMPLPWPRDYLEGLDQQRKIMEQAHPVYLDDVWSTQGFTHYYLMTLWYKLPHTLQALFALSLGCLLVPRGVARLGRWQWFLALPAAVLIAVASSSGMQLGIRYILPCLPFLILIAAQAGRWMNWKQAPLRTMLILMPLVLAPTALRHHPYYLTYFNELAGGPVEGRWHLLDSNLDWGQSLGELKEYLDRERIQDVGLAYFGTFPPAEMGIRYHLPPARSPLPGWYAVSVNFVQGRPHTVREPNGIVRSVDLYEFGYFRFFRPVARIGYAIDVYHLSPFDVQRWAVEWQKAQSGR